jgi:hypothetical protein
MATIQKSPTTTIVATTVELFMLSHVEKRKKSVVGKSIVLRGQKVV